MRTMSNKQKTGKFWGIPYDWRTITRARIKERTWNPDDPRIFTPHVYGWGWTINPYQLLKKMGIVFKK